MDYRADSGTTRGNSTEVIGRTRPDEPAPEHFDGAPACSSHSVFSRRITFTWIKAVVTKYVFLDLRPEMLSGLH